MLSSLYSYIFRNGGHSSMDSHLSSQEHIVGSSSSNFVSEINAGTLNRFEQGSEIRPYRNDSMNSISMIAGLPESLPPIYFYNCGYQAASEEHVEQLQRLEEEKQSLLDLEREMKCVFESYVNKAACELKRINGEELCDVYYLQEQISAMKRDILFLNSLFSTLHNEFVRDLQEQQSHLELLYKKIRCHDKSTA